VEKIPSDLKASPLVKIVPGDLLDPSSCVDGVYSDETIKASKELMDCLEGCSAVVACFGATRRTKLPTDLIKNPEDIDPIHAKQINCRSMMALSQACKANNAKIPDGNTKIQHVVRITGKGEDPNGIFSILLNGLGAFCKAWNYQGEVVLRQAFKEGDIGYTIVRPGILKKEDSDDDAKTKKDDDKPVYTSPDDLLLADNGGNDLAVTPVTYAQVATLLVDLVQQAKTKQRRVTLAAMNPKDETTQQSKSLLEKIDALNDDSREYPQSLVAEHKAAVKAFFTKVAAVGSVVGVAFATLIAKLIF